MPAADAHRRLQALPGVSPWTSAESRSVALGDADAVAVGDFHLPHLVGYALTGERRSFRRAHARAALPLARPPRPRPPPPHTRSAAAPTAAAPAWRFSAFTRI